MNLRDDEIRAYLDEAITRWRAIGRGEFVEDATDSTYIGEKDRGRFIEMAPFYVDAFQSVRSALLGQALPPCA